MSRAVAIWFRACTAGVSAGSFERDRVASIRRARIKELQRIRIYFLLAPSAMRAITIFRIRKSRGTRNLANARQRIAYEHVHDAARAVARER